MKSESEPLPESKIVEIESNEDLRYLLSDWKGIKREEKNLLARKRKTRIEIEEKLINLTEGMEILNHKFQIPTLNLWVRFDKFPDYPLLEGQQKGYHIKLVIAPIVKRR